MIFYNCMTIYEESSVGHMKYHVFMQPNKLISADKNNVGKEFLSLLERAFPPNNPLHKLFARQRLWKSVIRVCTIWHRLLLATTPKSWMETGRETRNLGETARVGQAHVQCKASVSPRVWCVKQQWNRYQQAEQKQNFLGNIWTEQIWRKKAAE